MKVNEVMTKTVHTAKPDDSIKKIAALLYGYRISGVPIVNNEGELVGIVSEKDILKAIYPTYAEFHEDLSRGMDFEEMESRYRDVTDLKAQDLMTKNVIAVTPDTPVLKVASLMVLKRIRRVPVVENKQLVGIVSQGDIHQAIFKKELLGI